MLGRLGAGFCRWCSRGKLGIGALVGELDDGGRIVRFWVCLRWVVWYLVGWGD